MNQYIELFKNYFAQNPIGSTCCEMKTLLGMLCCCYRQRKGSDSESIQRDFDRLDALLSRISASERDQVVDITCRLCSDHQQEAFEDGVLTGFRLFTELMPEQ